MSSIVFFIDSALFSICVTISSCSANEFIESINVLYFVATVL